MTDAMDDSEAEPNDEGQRQAKSGRATGDTEIDTALYEVNSLEAEAASDAGEGGGAAAPPSITFDVAIDCEGVAAHRRYLPLGAGLRGANATAAVRTRGQQTASNAAAAAAFALAFVVGCLAARRASRGGGAVAARGLGRGSAPESAPVARDRGARAIAPQRTACL